jgi:signal transduction histidine kinase
LTRINLTLENRVWIGGGLLLLALLGVSAASYISLNSFLENTRWVEQTHQIITKAIEARLLIIDQQRATRGYVLTGEARILEPYYEARKRTAPALDSLRALIKDNPQQAQRLDRLRPLVDQRIRFTDELLDVRRRQGEQAAQRFIVEGPGTALAERLLAGFEEMEQAERNLLQERRQRQEASSHPVLLSLVLVSILALGLFVLGGTAITRGLRMQQESKDQLAQQAHALEAANRELEAFTYSVSHDLRAPLRHIDGFSKILMESYAGSLDEEGRRYLERVRTATQQMGRLIDDLLNLARVGRREVRWQVTGLQSLVETTRDELRSEAEGRAIEWRVGSLPFVECDPALMKQVFANLLSNAMKFTRPRSPAVIEVGQRQENGRPVVYVRDNGVGFSMKYADKLFGVFQRFHRQEDFEGTGVGLATVQRIVHMHGGNIWAEAELDKGATFYFSLGSPGESKVQDSVGKEGTA